MPVDQSVLKRMPIVRKLEFEMKMIEVRGAFNND